MAKIVITSPNSSLENSFVIGLKKIVLNSLSDIREALNNETPIFEQELFLNNYEEVAKQLREIEILRKTLGVELNYYELQPDEEFESCPLAVCKINAEILENILTEWENGQ